jgi:hypothetical protein
MLAALDPEEFPVLIRTAPLFAVHDERDQLDFSVEMMLAGLRERLASR